jgi:hypothetical protein
MALLPTFADWLEAFGLPDAPDNTQDERVTIAWLQYHQAVAEKVDEMHRDPVAGENLRRLHDILSEDIIDSHLGAGWFSEHVDDSSSSKQGRNYFNTDGPPAIRLLAAHRAHELARRLYQLQSFPWFDDVLRRVSTRELSGAGFELDVVFVLHNLVARVTPVEETGHKGDDYDILLDVYGIKVPVEAKAKDDDTPYTMATVINTVKGAASQLPRGGKGIVFLRLPTPWLGPELEETYADALTEATRQTSRVGAVITAIDKQHLNEDQTAGHVTRVFDYFMVPDCPEELWTACMHLKEILDSDLDIFAPPAPF